MIYITEEENSLVKYEITLDENKLRNLKYTIIENCGKIKHFDYQSTRCRHNPYSSPIGNYSEEFICVREYNDFYSPDEDVYRYIYNLYEDTPLSLMIDRLLEGDSSVIRELEYPRQKEKSEADKNPIADELNSLLTQDISEMSPWKLQQFSKKLEEYQINQKLNQDRKSDFEYYEEVLKCITKKEVSRISTDKVQKLCDLLLESDCLIQEMKPFFEETTDKQVYIPSYQKAIGKLIK